MRSALTNTATVLFVLKRTLQMTKNRACSGKCARIKVGRVKSVGLLMGTFRQKVRKLLQVGSLSQSFKYQRTPSATLFPISFPNPVS